jgi:hypothetical protein
MKIAQIILVSTLLLTGCASHHDQPEEPKPPEPTKGISSYAPDKFRVIYEGTRWTKPERATDFAMLRAADTTLQHGYTYFVILSQSQTMQDRSWSTPSSSYSTVMPNGSIITSGSGGGTSSISWPYITLMIQTYTNEVSGALDAAFLKASLFKQYDRTDVP